VGRQVVVAEYPEAACTVIELECARVCGCKGIYNATGDGDLFATKLAWIAIDGFNARMMRAS